MSINERDLHSRPHRSESREKRDRAATSGKIRNRVNRLVSPRTSEASSPVQKVCSARITAETNFIRSQPSFPRSTRAAGYKYVILGCSRHWWGCNFQKMLPKSSFNAKPAKATMAETQVLLFMNFSSQFFWGWTQLFELIRILLCHDGGTRINERRYSLAFNHLDERVDAQLPDLLWELRD
jgi:hypothetical protein